MQDIIESKIEDVNTEMLVVGSIYTKPDILLDYGDLIRPQWDFYHDTARFLYQSLYEIYHYHVNENITEAKINVYMNQDDDRKSKYKEIGGYRTIYRIMSMSDVDDFDNYYNDLKKFSLLRELEKKGYPAQKIYEKKVFNRLTAEEIVQSLVYTIETISTEVGGIQDSIKLGEDLLDVYEGWKINPDFGEDIPFEILNLLIRGWRKKKFNLLGLHSGFGKSRLTSFLAAYVGIKLQTPLLIMVNEQEKSEWDAMMISAVVNNPIFGYIDEDSVHKYGIDETKIVTGQCDAVEDELCKNAINWIRENSEIRWMFINRMSHSAIRRQIKRHKIRGCDFFIYDTLKSSDHDWVSFVKLGDMLKDICSELDVGGWATFQLTDDSLFDEILTSKAIASGKHVKHIADGLMMAKPIPRKEYKKYRIYNPHDKFKNKLNALDQSFNFYSVDVDKNRGGTDKVRLCFKVDKGKNYWCEVGYLINADTSEEDQKRAAEDYEKMRQMKKEND